jgi:hypothetical protein
MRFMKRVHIFKTGKQTDRKGISIDFTDALLAEVAASYDPTKHEAPIVVGHPQLDAPAYGWVKSVGFSDGNLFAEPHQVDAAFSELVTGGKFKKVSASFYLPDSPGNPCPGKHYLRHVGFLGAMPPAVKGLKQIEFSASEEGVVEFGDWELSAVARLFGRIRDFFIEREGVETADKLIPSYEVEWLTTAAAKSDSESSFAGSTSYAEAAASKPITHTEGGDPVSDANKQAAEFAERESALSKQAADLKAREEAIAAKERQAARQGSIDFVEGLVKSGQVLPVQKAAFVEALCALDGSAPVEFSEGDKKVSKSPREALVDALNAMPKVVEFGELARPDKSLPALSDDPMAAGREIAKRAAEFADAEAKAGRTVNLSQAIDHVTKEEA